MSVLRRFKKALYGLISPTRRAKIESTASRILSSATAAAYAHYVDTPSSEALSNITNAAVNLAKAFEQVDNVVARLGPILYVKYTLDGKTFVRTETISPSLARILDGNPQLMSSPRRLVKHLDQTNT